MIRVKKTNHLGSIRCLKTKKERFLIFENIFRHLLNLPTFEMAVDKMKVEPNPFGFYIFLRTKQFRKISGSHSGLDWCLGGLDGLAWSGLLWYGMDDYYLAFSQVRLAQKAGAEDDWWGPGKILRARKTWGVEPDWIDNEIDYWKKN